MIIYISIILIGIGAIGLTILSVIEKCCRKKYKKYLNGSGKDYLR